MFMFKRFFCALCLLALVKQASAQELLRVFPDGSGLPQGQGNVQQGEVIYKQQCVACHGENGRGASAEELVGEYASLVSEYPDKTIGSYWRHAPALFAYIYKAMPPNKPRSLTFDEVYAVSAYLLFLNGLLERDVVLDAEILRSVEMPNRDGFFRP